MDASRWHAPPVLIWTTGTCFSATFSASNVEAMSPSTTARGSPSLFYGPQYEARLARARRGHDIDGDDAPLLEEELVLRGHLLVGVQDVLHHIDLHRLILHFYAFQIKLSPGRHFPAPFSARGAKALHLQTDGSESSRRTLSPRPPSSRKCARLPPGCPSTSRRSRT